jgi:hypothetical protein
LSEVLPNLLTDGISVGLDDLMPHFFQRPVSVSRHFSFHANISDFFYRSNVACRLGDMRVGT